MMSKPVKITVWTAVLIGASAVLWLVFRPAAVPCDIESVKRGTLTVTVDEDGRTRLKERYIVSAPLPGYAGRIALKSGDPVVAGTTSLVRIVPREPTLLDERTRAQAEARVRASEAAVSRAVPELARCEAELEHVRAEYERLRSALELGAASVQEFENERILLTIAENAAESARFALDISVFELEQARAALLQNTGPAIANRSSEQAYEILSPITGKVLRIYHESSGIVNAGDPLIELGSLSDLEVEVDVLSDQAVRVRPHQRVLLQGWGGEQSLRGVVRTVEPAGFTKVSALGVDEQRVNVIIDFLDSQEERANLGIGFRIQARIIVLEMQDVVQVPVGALIRHRDGWAVYVAEAGRARLRPVTIGERASRYAQVLSGLGIDEQVIVYPSDRVQDGVRVFKRGR